MALQETPVVPADTGPANLTFSADESPAPDATPVPFKPKDNLHTPTDSLVSINLTDHSRESLNSNLSRSTSPKEVLAEVLSRDSRTSSVNGCMNDGDDDIVPSPTNSTAPTPHKKQKSILSRSNSTANSSTRSSTRERARERSNSTASDGSVQVDWESLDRTEQTQDQQDEQTTLLLARLEQENNAIAIDPKSGLKRRARGQSRPPSVMHLHKLVQEQGARSVRFSLLPAAAPMTELDFWAALVRDYPQTAQRLPTITSNKIRSGIPAPLRGVVWVSMAGARDRGIEEQFEKLLVEPSPYERIIGKDVGRSFPQHQMFRDPDGEGQKMLGRVLKCYSLYDDKIGYCQGLGFLVGPLLMNMGDKEAFCILVRLMEDYDLRSCFLPDLSGLHLRIFQFNRLLKQHVPKVSAHLDYLGVQGEYLSQWFLSFFAVTCPLPLLFRIYDVVFAEGASETIMRVALSIMQRNERKILAFTEFEDVMQLLLSRQLWDVYGLSAASADEFVSDFVAFTSLVTRESLNAVEAKFREVQGRAGERTSFLPGVSSAASRFLGRLWSSPKPQNLAPTPAADPSRPSSTLLRTPSKQSLSTIGSVEGTSESSTGTASTAMTDLSIITRDSSVDANSLKSTKSPDSMPPPSSRHRHQQSTSKERELDGQIEDLLTVLSEMQKNQALLTAQLQKIQEERTEEQLAVQAFLDQVKQDITVVSTPKNTRHRRVASEVKKPQEAHKKLSPTTLRLFESLTERLSAQQHRQSAGYETKADLRHTVAQMREQLHVETTRSQELARQLEGKEHESSSLRDELQKARARIKDSHFERQRLEKNLLDLRHAQRQNSGPPSRSNSKSSREGEELEYECREASDHGKKGGLRELRLGRGISRTNSNGPTQVFSKRTSSLAHLGPTQLTAEPLSILPGAAGSPSRGHNASASVPAASTSHGATPDDSVLLELASAKTAEAMARQELEELRAKFDAMRKTMSVTPPIAPPRIDPVATLTPVKTPDAPAPNTAPASAGGFGFFGWGKR